MDLSRFIPVPAQKFVMGLNPDEFIGTEYVEHPRINVSVDAFRILETPVTVGDWEQFVEKTGYDWPFTAPPEDAKDRLSYPITFVSWYDCEAYCKWLSAVARRTICLPTEAQWECACRGSDGRLYPWGNDKHFTQDELDELFYPFARGIDTEVTPGRIFYPVKWKKSLRSACGCYDMWLNVMEWCMDWHDEEYLEKNAGKHNPIGPPSGKYKSVRGGHDIDGCPRCSNRRMYIEPDRCIAGLGFRPVMLEA